MDGTTVPPPAMGRRAAALLPALALTFALLAGCTELGEERLIFFPTAAHLDEKQEHWVVPVEGWVFVPKRGKMLRDWGFDWLFEGKQEEREAARKVFESRADAFIVDGKSGRIIAVQIGKEQRLSPPTDSAGRFAFEVELPTEQAAELADDGTLEYRARIGITEPRDYEGMALMVGPTGVSVISDIDDTIKISEVTVKGEMMKNMFLREFRAVPGMAEAYRRWAEQGATFHYVSGSPSQLFQSLYEFTRSERFPDAVFALKRIGWFDSFTPNIWRSATQTKPPIIDRILTDFPERDFILVGDSGEHDPEVYGDTARKHPGKVLRVYIRDVTGQTADDPRYAHAFRNIPRRKWVIFTDPADLEPIETPEARNELAGTEE